MSDDATLLEVRDLVKHYSVTAGVFSREVGRVRAVDGVSFEIAAGETLGLVGESGCGKTTVGRTLLRLEEPTSGSVHFDGRDLRSLAGRELRELRRSIQMVFQDPMSSLNPRMTVRDIVGEPLAVHRLAKGADLDERVISLLEKVGIPGAWRNRYPHEFSGGQRQRIGIARALALGPKLIVCDEAVSALDVSVRAQVLNLLIDLRAELGLSYLFISHDLSVVRHVSDRIAVMYLGQIVEVAKGETLFGDAVHPYTRALLSAIPVPDPRRHIERIVLEGDVPSPISPPPGCRFHTRCPAVMARCRREMPEPVRLPDGHEVRCFLVDEQAPGDRAGIERRREEAVAANRAAAEALPEAASASAQRGAARPLVDPEAAPSPVLQRAVAVGLAALLLLFVVRVWPPARDDLARAEQAALTRELRAHQEITGELPAQLSELGWRLYEVFEDGEPRDPWGRAWAYRRAGEGFELRSAGPDGQQGDADDIVGGQPPGGTDDGAGPQPPGGTDDGAGPQPPGRTDDDKGPGG